MRCILSTFYLQECCLIYSNFASIITDESVGVVHVTDDNDGVPGPPGLVVGLGVPGVFPMDQEDGDDENDTKDGGTEDGVL